MDGAVRLGPGNIRRVGTGVTGITVPRLTSPFGAQLQRRNQCFSGTAASQNLVDGNTGANICTGGFVRVGSGEEAGGGSGMITGTISESLGIAVGQPTDEEDIFEDLLQRLQA